MTLKLKKKNGMLSRQKTLHGGSEIGQGDSTLRPLKEA